jgi:hypothetical protein
MPNHKFGTNHKRSDIEILPDNGTINWNIREKHKVQVTCIKCLKSRMCHINGVNKMRKTSSRCKPCDIVFRSSPNSWMYLPKIKDHQGYIHIRFDFFNELEQHILKPMALKYYKSAGRVAEHRAIVALQLGRPLLSHEIVHHKNGDRTDNRPENLILHTSKTHPPGHEYLGTVEYQLKLCEQLLIKHGIILPY